MWRSPFAAVVAAALCSATALAEESRPAICAEFKIDDRGSQPLSPATSTKNCKTTLKNGYPIPDPSCTPGAINPTLTTDVLRNPHFTTKCVRNDVTTEEQKTSTYKNYGIPHPADNSGPNQTCELDHLISLELGGADTLDNIWPQCGPPDVPLAKRYFKEKDTVENYLAAQVKEGKMKLEDAQQGIASDWPQYLSAAQSACPGGRCK